MTKKKLILLCLRAHEEIPLHLLGRCTVGLNFEPNLCAASYIAFYAVASNHVLKFLSAKLRTEG